MKKIWFFIILAGIVILSSCKKSFLDQIPTSSITAGNFYHTQLDIQQAVTGVYSSLSDWPVGIYWYLSEIRSNNYYVTSDGAQRDWYDFNNFQANAEDQTLHDTWQSLYQMVNRANEVLAHIDNVPFDNPALKTRYKAEVRFLRAFAYFQLVRLWGNVPLVDKVITPAEGIQIRQSSPADVYKFITNEMNAVKDSLPAQYTAASDMGRITSWAAKGILANVYLTMAGYPLEQKDKLDSAKTLLQGIIASEGSTPVLTLTPNYSDLWGYKNNNKHFMLEVEYASGGLGIGSTFPSQNIPPNLSTKLVNVRSLLFDLSVQVSPDLISSFDTSDLRFNATIDTSYVTSDNPPQHGSTPFFKKFVDFGLTNLTNYNDWPEDFPLLRYADVLLMYAEVLNDGAGSPPVQAVSILNRIRARAKLQPIYPATTGDFAQALTAEYRHEFADEGQYWFYLVRTGQAVQVMNNWFQATGRSKTISNNNLVYPIPQTEMDIYPGLYKQNSGY
ncbi:MAG: RagB/SusD family nutrient uptake outer membrane protein [Chitinophagaceae bacterium]|nr:MAG: RagB/SusD family nutrient uptake outer membrane protein [Chitinophagaceae bacterium]